MTFALASGIITQSGTDTDISGLSGIAGVATTTIDLITYYDIGNLVLRITGTLTHANFNQVLVTNYVDTSAGGSSFTDGSFDAAIDVIGGTFNIGSESTVNGATYRPVGLLIDLTSPEESGGTFMYQMSGIRAKGGGVINWYSGSIRTRLACGCSSDNVANRFNVFGTECRFIDNVETVGTATTEQPRQLRGSNSNGVVINGITLDGATSDRRARLFSATGFDTAQNLNFVSAEVQTQNGFGATGSQTIVIVGLSLANNRSQVDVALNINDANWADNTAGIAQACKLVNVDIGSGAFVNNENSSNPNGVCAIFQRVEVNTVDVNGSAIQNVSVYLPTTNNGDRRAVTGAGNPQHYNSWAFESTDFDSYAAITDVSGDSGVLEVILRAYINDTSTTFDNPDNILYNKSNTQGSDDFDIYLFEYGFLPQVQPVALQSATNLQLRFTQLPDANITESTKATVDAYATLDDAFEVYDRHAALVRDNHNTGILLDHFISRSGSQVSLGAVNMTVDSALASAIELPSTNVYASPDLTRSGTPHNTLNDESLNDAVLNLEFTTGTDITTGQVIFENGGAGIGIAFGINASNLEIYVGATGTLQLSHPVSASTSYQMTLSVDLTGDQLRLYVNETAPPAASDLVDSIAFTENDWCGGDDGGLGAIENSFRSPYSASFTGTIDSVLRVWTNTANVADSLNQVLDPSSFSVKSSTFTGGATATTGNVTITGATTIQNARYDCDITYSSSATTLTNITCTGTLTLDPGTYSFIGCTITNVAGSGVVINPDAATVISNNLGPDVTINVISSTLTVSNVPSGGILEIYDNDDTPADHQDRGTLLQTTNPTTGANVLYNHTKGGDDIIIVFVATGYVENDIPFNLLSADQTFDLSSVLQTEENL